MMQDESGTNRSIEKSNYLIGNRTRDFPACCTFLQQCPYLVDTREALHFGSENEVSVNLYQTTQRHNNGGNTVPTLTK
jgi:hypothetical protein